ncbi:MAG: hypothetical protein H6Q88_3564 [Anaeromyxobacteraceae bacterium]|nr:hypothetical protein [Anaeromyxobacteraceae bacterium]
MRGFLPAIALASVTLLSACRDWRASVDPSRAAAEPEQVLVDGEPVLTLEAKGHEVRLTPRATYRITGYAVETSRALLDEWDFALPMDLALAWGPVADPAVLRKMRFHLSGRYVSWWAEDGSLSPQVIQSHVANHHLVPRRQEQVPLPHQPHPRRRRVGSVRAGVGGGDRGESPVVLAAQDVVEPLDELAAREHLVHAGPLRGLHEVGLEVAEEPDHASGPGGLRRRDLLHHARLPEVHHERSGSEVPGGLLERSAARRDLHGRAEPLGGGQDLGTEDEVADGQEDGHARV